MLSKEVQVKKLTKKFFQDKFTTAAANFPLETRVESVLNLINGEEPTSDLDLEAILGESFKEGLRNMMEICKEKT